MMTPQLHIPENIIKYDISKAQKNRRSKITHNTLKKCVTNESKTKYKLLNICLNTECTEFY